MTINVAFFENAEEFRCANRVQGEIWKKTSIEIILWPGFWGGKQLSNCIGFELCPLLLSPRTTVVVIILREEINQIFSYDRTRFEHSLYAYT